MEGPKSISLLNHVSRLGFGSVSHQAHLVWRPDLHDSLRLGTFFFEAAISTTLPCTREGRDAMHANAPMPWLDRIPFRLAPPPMAMWTDEVQLVMLPPSSSSWWPYRWGRLKLGTRLSHWPIIAPTIRAEQKEASLPISVADGTVQFDWHMPALEGLVFLPSLIRFFWPRGEATLVARPLLSSLALGPPIAVLSIEGASKDSLAAGDGGGGNFAVAQEGVPPGVPRLRLQPEEGPRQGNAVQGVPLCLDGFSHGRYRVLFLYRVLSEPFHLTFLLSS